MAKSTAVDEYPSLLWLVIPPVVLLSAYFARKWYLARKLRLTGIGKGAPGFQTNVRKVRVTPEIMARIQRGEQVSPDEIAAAVAKAEEDERNGASPSVPETKKAPAVAQESEPANEWLPSSITAPKKRAKAKRK